MIALLLILIPILTGFATFFIKNEQAVKVWSIFSSLATLAVSVLGLTVMNDQANLQFGVFREIAPGHDREHGAPEREQTDERPEQ